MDTSDVYAQVLKKRRDAFAPSTTGDKLQQQMNTDPGVQFKKRIAKFSAQIARTNDAPNSY